jgi:8-oxo-dGTP pyrophosphatase MutT (NUDIX family)
MHLERREVVTAFLQREGKILLVRRSGKVGSYQGRWSAISGYLEEPTPLAQARREIREETGLADEDVRLIGSGAPLEIPAPGLGCCWVVHPFLFEIESPDGIRLDWENTELRWIEPSALVEYETVPMLREVYASACGVLS